jgi:hypothetical protein
MLLFTGGIFLSTSFVRIFNIYAYISLVKAKLNLTIEDTLLTKIKQYAAKRKTSVSELVEAYFTKLTKSSKRPNVVELMDSTETSPINLPDDLIAAYYEERKEKYGF